MVESTEVSGARTALLRAADARSVAVVGVSEDPLKYGSRLAASIIDANFGGNLSFVNPRGGRFRERSMARSLSEVGPVDVVIVSVPAARCSDVIAEAAQLGCGCAVVVATGFREVGAGDLEDLLRDAAAGFPLRMIGPNCMGFLSAAASLNAMGDATIPYGGIAVVAQSGIIGMSIYQRAKLHRLGLSYFFSVGNQLDLGFADICEFLADDDRTDTVLIYVEALRDLADGLSALGALARDRPVIALRGGRTAAGARSAASHTASIADDDAVLQAALHEAGVVEVESEAELMLAALAAQLPGTVPTGAVALVSDSGGFATLSADLAVGAGLTVAPASSALQAALRETLLPQASVQNPIDMIGGPELRPDIFERTVGACLRDHAVEGAVMLGGYGGYGDVGGEMLTERENAAAPKLVDVRDQYGKPFVVQTLYANEEHDGIDFLRRRGVPVVEGVADAVRIMAFKRAWSGRRAPRSEWTAASAPRDGVWLDEDAGRAWLNGRLPRTVPAWRTADSVDEAVEGTHTLGFPVAMKLLAEGLLHRSDVSGVELGLGDDGAVRAAWARLEVAAAAEGHTCRVLVTRHEAADLVAFVGMRRHPVLGPVLIVGTGGVFVEELRDRALLFPPVDAEALDRALGPLAIGRALLSARAQRQRLPEALRRLALAVIELAVADDELVELDLNPVLLSNQEARIVDVRVRAAALTQSHSL